MNNYQDIINLEHYEPKYHKRMSIYNRSAQFAPFQALTGYNESVKETSRLTDKEIYLTSDKKYLINQKLQIINKNINTNPLIKVTYFEKDKFKEGGKYCTYQGNIKKIDSIEEIIIFNDNYKINLNNIYDIDVIL